MITTYLLKNCPHCKGLLKFIQENPNLNMCLIIVSKNDIESIKKNEPRIQEFPVSFFGNPKKNGLPYKNAPMITGSNNILNMLQTNFGSVSKKLTGSNVDINYLNDNEGNISSLTNIRNHRNNCFGKTCHVMDRPYGPTDNQYILQGYQPSSAIPIRSDLPIKPCRETGNNNNNNNNNNNTSTNNFGMTTPGTLRWQSERKVWKQPNILVSSNNYEQNMLGNKIVKMNVPMTYKDDYINTNYYDPLKIVNMTNAEISKYNPVKVSKFGKPKSSKYGKFISGPVNQTHPFLTYSAGSNTLSRVTGKNFNPEQKPIQSSPKSSYLSKNIKDYVTKNSNSQIMLYEGLTPWSINAQGINNNNNNNNSYGSNVSNVSSKFKLSRSNKLIPSKNSSSSRNIPTVSIKQNIPFGNSNPWIMTRTPSGTGTNPAQYFKRRRFTNNGNSYGKNEKRTTNRTERTNTEKKKPMKFTSPLGIEISFE